MAELKAGGMAIVIGGPERLIGHVVELVSLTRPGGIVRTPDGGYFANGPTSRWLVKRDGIETTLSNGKVVMGYGLMYPQHLLPIDGDYSPDVLRYTKEIANA